MNEFRSLVPLQLDYELQCGDITSIGVGHDTRRRILPAALCVCPIDSVSEIMFDHAPPLRLAPPDVFLLPEGVPHRIRVIEGGRPISLWCHFRATVFQSISLFSFFDLPRIYGGERAQELRRLVTEQVAPREDGGDDTAFHLGIEFKLRGFQFVSTLLEAGTPKPGSARLSAGLSRLQPALKLLRQNWPHRISTAELAAAVKVSPSRFLALFREFVGMPPGEYREQQRFQNACALLSRSDLTLDAIAERLGFCDAFHFSRRFTREAGISPGHYRKLSM